MNSILENYLKNIAYGIVPGPFESVDDAIDQLCLGLAEVATIMVENEEIDIAEAMIMMLDLSKQIVAISHDHLGEYIEKTKDAETESDKGPDDSDNKEDLWT